MRPPFFYDSKRASKPMVMVPMTVEEAELAIEALRHVGREIFDGSPKGERLSDASTAVSEALRTRS